MDNQTQTADLAAAHAQHAEAHAKLEAAAQALERGQCVVSDAQARLDEAERAAADAMSGMLKCGVPITVDRRCIGAVVFRSSALTSVQIARTRIVVVAA